MGHRPGVRLRWLDISQVLSLRVEISNHASKERSQYTYILAKQARSMRHLLNSKIKTKLLVSIRYDKEKDRTPSCLAF